MYSDEIISEVWRNRDAYVEQHQHDMKQIINDLKKRQQNSQHKIVDRRTTEGKSGIESSKQEFS